MSVEKFSLCVKRKIPTTCGGLDYSMVGSVVLNDRIREAYLLGCENFGFCTWFVKIWKQLSIESHGHFLRGLTWA
jgi:hypothetical protein